MRFLGEVRDEHQRYLEGDRWFQARDGSPLLSVAYFSAEFGFAESLPTYSGGLGVLAGDHLKAPSDLGVPLVGVGLFYRQATSASRSTRTAGSRRLPRHRSPRDGAGPCDGIRVQVDLAGAPLVARVWMPEVGRVPLYLLDTDFDANPPDCATSPAGSTAATPSTGSARRSSSASAVSAPCALGIDTQVFHMNEGHAGFRPGTIRRLVAEHGLAFHEAIEAVLAGRIFTTHTPVPAGNDASRRS